jgi:very-short-patch-repair endonuclease
VKPNNSYNKELKSLSTALRAGMMKGYTFNRQRPVLNYIADFMCKELNLVIEVDGLTHSFEEVQHNDADKQQALEAAGFTVLRFTDNDVLNNINGVQMIIENWIIDFESH